ncbi:MAG: hypothetical protein KJ726_10820 [Verrucomicrobia bacterium]|nr:hypothetical protein [Verrucomicrobiota bacterium]MBU1910529.1 hypothetical protein [Verrucomicrobiota bacterium]
MPRWIYLFKAVVLLCLAAAGLEMVLTLASPEYRSLWNGRFEDQFYTWGHPVRPNRQGLREREIAVPKPDGVFRVLVLGEDSTWGPGLAEEERFTALAEVRLREAHPDRPIEVLNVGIPGASLPELRDVLLFWCEAPVQPDLVVVAFGAGIVRLDSNENRPEHIAFARRHPLFGLSMPRWLTTLRLIHTARFWRQAMARVAEIRGAVPSLWDDLGRRFAPDSPARLEDAAALRDIGAFCRAQGLPPPIFVNLNLTLPDASDESSRSVAGWYAQARRIAEEAGFTTTIAAPAIPAAVRPDARYINPLNGVHPRHLQGAYARVLARSIAPLLESRDPASPLP